ncbi:MAG: ribose 5-phosphate isomerase B [Elusimicrobia bacterium]|nr:ribose 5-phosphate isomerase B [Candidatus Liberimonas magnetica]
MQKRKFYIGSDHAGYNLKEYVKSNLNKKGYVVEDLGTYDKTSVDYPDFAKKVAIKVSRDKDTSGVLICGTGIGISIAANKVPGIRAALCNDPACAALARKHNDANILVLAGRRYNKRKVDSILKSWLKADFEGGRHLRRVNKIKNIEREFSKKTNNGCQN